MILNVSNAQVGTISTGINVQLNYGKLSTGLGLNLGGEYFISERYAVRLNSSFMFSSFDRQEYFASDPFTLIGFEGTALYYFKKETIQPYAGLGLGYYIPETHLGGMPHTLPMQALALGNDLYNDYGINAIGGFLISPDNPISFRIEVKYLYLKPKWIAHIEDGNPKAPNYDREDKINLSMFVTNFSIVFHL